jgi:hypothetical protein
MELEGSLQCSHEYVTAPVLGQMTLIIKEKRKFVPEQSLILFYRKIDHSLNCGRLKIQFLVIFTGYGSEIMSVTP